MKAQAIISLTTKDMPRIKPVANSGAEVTFELYDVSIDELLKLCEKELLIEINVEKSS